MENRIKVIKDETDYREALSFLETLMLSDPQPETDEYEQLAVLAVLIEKYEEDNYPIGSPDAITAIKFRMEQLGLKPVDLVPFIGPASRVSEILSGKRSLTVDMINNLSHGLGIPAESLLKKPTMHHDNSRIDINNSAYKQMLDRGYFSEGAKIDASDKFLNLKRFFDGHSLSPAYLRQSSYRSSPTTDYFAISAWAVKVQDEAEKNPPKQAYKNENISIATLTDIARLSRFDDGPLRVRDKLRNLGVSLVIEPHLEKTRLDGAAILKNKKHPIIGLTLRMDRIDNFWFTIMHELAHLFLHYEDDDIDTYFDELDPIKGERISSKEKEADEFASQILIPEEKWQTSSVRVMPHPLSIAALANELNINQAIIAGKFRHDTKNYNKLVKMVGESKVRFMFKKEENE